MLPLYASATTRSEKPKRPAAAATEQRVVGALMQRLFANVAESSEGRRGGEPREGREII